MTSPSAITSVGRSVRISSSHASSVTDAPIIR
jgi:hypothetical protein